MSMPPTGSSFPADGFHVLRFVPPLEKSLFSQEWSSSTARKYMAAVSRASGESPW